MLLAGEFGDRCPKLVAVDRLRQIALKARGAPAGIPHALRDDGDGRDPAPLADVHVAKPLEELAAGVLGRDEVTHDDVGDERHADCVGRAGRRDDGAPQLEHRPEVMTSVQVVVDDQHVNALKLRETDITLTPVDDTTFLMSSPDEPDGTPIPAVFYDFVDGKPSYLHMGARTHPRVG